MAVASAQVVVSAAPAPLTTADTDNVSGQRVVVHVPGATGVYLGGPGVSATTGFLLAGGATSPPIHLAAGETLYGYAAVSVTVHVLRAGT